jgi:hypothetical protein
MTIHAFIGNLILAAFFLVLLLAVASGINRGEEDSD